MPQLVGTETQVNLFTAGSQDNSSITTLADGGFVVVWASDGQDGSGYGVRGQRYSADGVAVGAEFAVNTFGLSGQIEPEVAATDDGGFVVVWTDQSGIDGSGWATFGRRFEASGEAAGDQFRVNTSIVGSQYTPHVAGLDGGGFVVVWHDDSNPVDGSGLGIFAQRYDATGSTVGGEFLVNEETQSTQANARVAALVGGGFVVTWTSATSGPAGDGSSNGVFARRYDVTGTVVGGEFQVNTTTANNQSDSAIAALGGGGFVVVWSSEAQDGSTTGVYAQRFDATGVAVGTEFRVNTTTANAQSDADVAALDNGGFVVTWTDNGGLDGSGIGVFAQEYAADGSAVDGEFRVNTEFLSTQNAPAVTGLPGGNYVVTWTSFTSGTAGDGSSNGVFLQILGDPADFTVQSDPVLAAVNASVTFDEDTVNAVPQLLDANAAVALSDADSLDLDGGQVIVSRIFGSETADDLIDRDPAAEDQLGVRNQGTASGQIGVSGSVVTYGGTAIGVISSDGADGAALVIDLNAAADVAAVEALIENLTYANTSSDPIESRRFEVLVRDGDGGQSAPVVVTVNVVAEADGALPVLGERQVNAFEAASQDNPAIATLADGGYVMVWRSAGQDGSGTGIVGRLFESNGAPRSTEFLVNSTEQFGQSAPRVAVTADGGFVVVWTDEGGADGSAWGTFGQRFDATGAVVGDEFLVNTRTINSQYAGDVAGLAGGGFVVVWQDDGGADGSGLGVFGQRFDAAGAPAGAEFRVNTEITSTQDQPAVAGLAGGGFVVTWASATSGTAGDGSSDGVFAQRYDASGTALGGEFRVNTTTANAQNDSAIGALTDGGFVVVWSSNGQDGSGIAVYAQRYDAAGVTVGGEFRVSTTISGSQFDAEVVGLDNGGFVVTWTDNGGTDGSGSGVFGQQYGADGARVDGQFRVNTQVSSTQDQPAVTALPGAGFVVAWTSTTSGSAGDGDGNGVFQQRFGDPAAFPVQAGPVVALQGAVTFTEDAVNAAPQRLFDSVAVGDLDSPNFDGGQLSIARITGFGDPDVTAFADLGAADQLAVASTGFGPGQIAVVGNAVSFGGVVFGTILSDGADGAALTVSLNALASPSAVEALLEHVTYANTSDDPALSRTFEVLLSDGDGGSATPRTVSVTVTPSEDGAEPIGGEQQVNTFVTSAQDEPAVAALSGGGFVVVWTSFGQDGDADGIYAQRYTAEGVPTGPEFQVSTTQVGNQNTARVTGTADGGFVVSWTDQSGIDGSASAVLAQRFDASGATLGAEFRVNTTTSNSQDRPELAGLPGGGFVVVWQDNGSADGSGFGVFGQRYDATGTAVGAQFQVNTEFSSSQFEPVVTALNGGGFVVVWTSVTSATAGDGNGQGVFAQRYDAAGTPLGGEFRVNTFTTNDQDQPSIAALADGGFVVAWTSRNQDGSFQGIYAQRHDASGAPVGVEFRVNTTTSNDQFDSAVVGLDDGGFVVTWTDDGGADGSGFGVFAQEFAADGSRVDGEFRVNTEISSTQNQPAIAALPNGAFAVVWTSVTSGSAGDGSSNGVFLQVYGDPATFTQQANPVIDAVNATVTYVEDVVNAAPQLLDANGAAVVSDADSADFDGGQLQVSRLTGLPVQYAQIQPPDDGSQDQLGIRNQGSGAGQIGVSGSDVTFGGTVIGTIVSDGVDGADLIVSLNANATVAAVDALVENLTYRNISDAPLATRDVVITLSDGDGGSSEPRVITVNITPSIDGQVAVGDEYQVNTTTADAQESAASATLADGSYVVVWESRLQDGSGEGVYAQRFDASGTPLGVEFRVNTTTASDQREPDVAALSGGGFVVTWTDTAIDGSGTAVMAQRFATDGSALGAEFRVNTTTSGNQTDAAIAGVGTGFVVVWTDQASADGSSWGVFGQRYDAAGTALGAEFRVNTTTTNAQYEPAIAALAGGGFVVVWRDDSGGDGNAAGIFGQRYDAAGAAVGAEFQINSQTASSQFDPSVAGLVGGGFVVSWTSNAAAPTGDGSGNAVFAQRFDASGATVGAEFRVNETTLSNQTDSDVVALGGGGFVVTWSDDSGRDGSGQGVFGQQYDVDGHRVDGQFQVNTEFSSTQSQSVLNALGGDTFAVHWTSFTSSTAGDGSSNGVFGQLFGPPGAPPGPGDFAPIGEETEANVFQAGDQAEPAVAALAGGGYVVVWQSDGQDANGSGIFAQRFTGEGIPLGPEFQVNTNEAGAQVIPTVTGLVGGGFVVAWTDQGGADGSGQGVFAQRFDGNGDPVGSEFRVNTQTQSTQNDPAATALAGGGFVVTWVSTTSGPAGDGSGEGVYGQVYDAAGVTVGGEFRLNETTAGNQNDVAVSSLPSGGFVAAWVGNDASGLGVFARRFDATGSAVAPEFQVNVQTASTQSQPAVAVLDGGGFVVTWTSISSGTAGDGSGNGVFARLYDAAGAAVGGEFRVNTTTASNQSESSVAALDDGGFVVSWTDDSGIDGNALAVVAQRFDAAGAAVGDQFVVNDDNVSWQYQSAVAGLANGAFVATFSSYHDSNGSTRDVETRLFGDPADFSLQANPELEGLSTQVTFAEDDVNAAPQLIDADAAVAVSDLDSADFDGGRVIVSRIFGTETLDEVRLGDPHAQDQVGIRDQGIGAGQIGVSGGSVTFGGTVIGTIGADDGDGRDLVVELNASATAAAVTALVSNLTYRNTSSDPIASRQLEVLVQDGDGGQSTPVVVTVVVTEQPDGVVPLFDERESNTFQTGEQLEPAVASLAGGGYVVVWRSALQDGDSNGIVARVHSADGVIASTEILVNDTALGSQTDPSVAALTGGGFVVTWTATTTGNAGDGSGTGVFGQRFDASGTPVGSEFQVNTQTFSTQDESVVVGLPGGGFLVVWSSASGSGAGDGNSTGVIGQRFDAGGSPVGGEFVVNEQTTAVQDQAAVAVLAGGGFVVTWTSQTSGTAGDGSGDGVFARLFDAGGVAVGGEFQVNTFTASTQDESAVAALSGGGFVVVWTSSNQDGSGSGIYAQRYDAAGVAVGTEFQVHTTTASNQFDASVVGLTTGGFVVTWSDDGGLDGNSRAVVAQEFAADGSRVDGPFVVNQDNVSWQFEGVVSALPNGAFVAAFSSYHDTGGTTADIETRLFGDPADFSRQGDPDLLIAPQVTLAENDVNAGPQLIQSTTAVALSDDSADLDGGRLVVARITGYGNTDLGTLFDLDAQDVLGIRNQGTGVGEIGISGSTVSFGGVAFGTIVSDGSAGSDLVVSFGPAASEDAVEALIENLTYANPSDAPFPTRTYEVLVLDGDGGASDRRTVTVDISQDEDGAVPLFGETRVNTFTDNAQNQSAVASLADGGYVIVWHSNGQDGDAGGVFAQRYTDVGVIAGPEFQVNTEELLVQDEPVVAGLAGGGFVVVWTGQSSSTIFGDGNGDGVFAQVFGASGLPVGGEFRVNSQTSSNQNEPAVTALVGGGFVVTWTSVASGTAGDGSGLGVFGQRYDASGAALGGEFRVNTQVSSNQSDSAVAALGDGGFLVVWTSFTSGTAGDGSGDGVFAQRYDASGVAVGGEFQVNTTTASTQDEPAVAGLDDGGFVVVWTSLNQDGSSEGVYAQRYDAAGATVDTEFRVNTTALSNQRDAAVVGLDNGGFVVVWADDSGADGSSTGVRGQEFAANNDRVDGEFQVNTEFSGVQEQPAVAALPGGGFVVSFTSQTSATAGDGSNDGVFHQMFGDPALFVRQGNPSLEGFQAPTYIEDTVNLIPQLLDLDGALAVADADSPNFDGGQLSVTPLADQLVLREQFVTPDDENQDQLGIRNQGTGTGQIGVSGLDVTYEGVTIGTLLASGTRLVVSLNANADAEAVEALAENITYRNLSDAPLPVREFAVILTDGDGGASEPQVVRVTVTPSVDGAVEIFGERQVNQTTLNAQEAPASALLTDGSYVVVWESLGQDGAGEGIYARLFDANGNPLGAELPVNTTTADDQRLPDVAALSDGGFVVVWNDDIADGSGSGIFGQRFDGAGVAQGTEFRVNTTVFTTQNEAAVTGLADGGFVVTWTSQGQDGSGAGIYAQRYDASGVATGAEARVNTTTNSAQSDSSVSALADGGFVVVWADQSGTADTSSTGVIGQRFDAAGAAVGGEFRVNTETDSTQDEPSVTGLQGGGFVVTWTSFGQDGSGDGVFAQIYAADGTPLGGEFRVNESRTADQFDSEVVALDGGGFAVVYTDNTRDGSGLGVFVQQFNAVGNRLDGETQVNTEFSSSQFEPAVNPLQGGGFAVHWTSATSSTAGDGSSNGVFSQLFGNAAPTVTDVIANGVEDVPLVLDAALFDQGFEDVDGQNLQIVRIDVLPASGVLTLGGTPVIPGQEIARVDLVAGNLVYDGNQDFFGLDQFAWVGSDGLVFSNETALTNINLAPVNDLPVLDAGGPGSSTEGAFFFRIIDIQDPDPDTWSVSIDWGDGSIDTNLDTSVRTPNFTHFYSGDGLFTVTVTVDDNSGEPGSVVVDTFVVDVANAPPIARNDFFATDEDTPVGGNLLLNNGGGGDGDPGGDPLSIAPSSVGTFAVVGGGQITIASDGTFTYDPLDDFQQLTDIDSEQVTFVYTLQDDVGATDTATVFINISGISDAPSAVDDFFTTDEDTPVVGNVLDNDQDPEGDALFVTSTGQTFSTSGRPVTVNADGSFTYDPGGAFQSLAQGTSTTDTFTYTVDDGTGSGDDAGLVTITIEGVNDAPSAGNDFRTTDEDSPLLLIGLLGNDFDIDAGDSFSITSVDTSALLGTLTDNLNGTYTYDPNGAFESLGVLESDSTSFTYTITDGFGGTDVGTVTITVQGRNDAPIALDDDAVSDTRLAFGEDEGGRNITAAILGNDTDVDASDVLTVSALDTTGTLGSVSLVGGVVTYDPNGQFDALNTGETATDTFTYTVSDGNGGTDTATVTVTINGSTAANQPPVAVDDDVTTDPDLAFGEDEGGRAITADILGNDTDPDVGNVLSVTAVDDTGTQGSVSLVGGVVTYDPNGAFESLAAGESATDTFSYTVSDGNGGTDTATVTVTIDGANDAPDAVDDSVTTDASLGFGEDEGGRDVTAALLGNDTDVDASDVLSVTSVDDTGTQGSVSLVGGVVTYDPNGAFESLAVGESATDTFSYTVSDGNGGTDTATVTVTIDGANDAPDAVDDSVATDASLGFGEDEGGRDVTAALLGNDSDVDASDVLSVSSVDDTGTQGSVSLVGGVVTYDPNGAFESLAVGESATDTFTYTVSDGNGGTDTATVTVTIDGANDAPDAVDDSVATDASLGFGEDEGGRDVTAALLGNDTDVDASDVLTVSSVDDTGTQGTVLLVGGVVTYDPNGAFESLAVGESATDTFTYTVSDGNGGTDTATVTVTIDGANDAPDAVDDSVATDASLGFGEDEGGRDVTAALLGNDSDVDASDVLSVSSVDDTGTQGAVSLVGGVVTYDPNGAFESLAVGESATDTFTYTVSDGNGGTDTATVTVTIDGANDAPDAVDDSVATDPGLAFGESEGGRNITAAILGNDTDVDTSDVLTVSALDTTGTLGSVSLVGGVVTYDPNGQFDALNTGETATDTFTYTVSDGNGGTDTATVTVTINGSTAANQPPVAVDDDVTTDPDLAFGEDEGGRAITADILGNDTDPDVGNVLSVTAVDDTGTQGSVSLVGGVVTYDPNGAFESLAAGESATDTFSYTVSDGNGGTDTATVTVTIDGANDAPDAVDDSVTTDASLGFGEDEGGRDVTAALLGNDTDVDASDVLSVSSVDDTGTQGSVSLVGGVVTYDPNGAFESLAVGESATDTFSYTVSDGNGGTDTATVTVTIDGANDAPDAVDDSVATDASLGFGEDEGGRDVTAALLGNDTDVDASDVLTVSSVDDTGTQGAVSLVGGVVTYDPNGAFESLAVGESATDTFTYTVSDGNGGTDTATVTVTIDGANDAPDAVDDSISTDAGLGFGEDEGGRDVTAALLANDTDVDASDVLTVSSVDDTGTQGTVLLVGGVVTYDPNGAFESLAVGESATDTFTYTVSDGNGGTDTATVTVTIDGANDAPDAVDDSISTDAGLGFGEDEGGRDVTAALLANDTDVDASDVLTVSSVDDTGTQGAVSLVGGVVTYDPNGAFESLAVGESATDTFTYTVSDGNGGTDTATVTVTIDGANDAPDAVDDSISTDASLAFGEGEGARAITAAILGNDTDADANDVLTVSALDTTGTLGSVSLVGGVVTYDPNGQFDALNTGETATDTFTYTVSDGNGGTDTATVTVTINGSTAANQPPVAVDDDVTTDPDLAFGEDEGGRAITADILGNDTDPDVGNVLSVTAVDDTGTQGAVSLVGGVVTYDPNGAFESLAVGESATDTFTYTVSDGNGGTDTATVTVTIDGANDAPDAVDDSVATDASLGFGEDEAGRDVTAALLGNDSDVDASDVLSVSSVDDTGTQGLVSLVGGVVTYDPNGAFESLAVGESATDTFTYTVSDGNGGTDTATVTVTIDGANDAPDAVDDSVATDPGLAFGESEGGRNITAAILGNDTDVDASDVLTVSALDTTGTLGTVSLVGGVVTYDPNGQFDALNTGETATDTFTYTVSDGNGGTDTATVTVTINGSTAANQPPVAVDDDVTTDPDLAFGEDEGGRAITADILGNDTDADPADVLTVSAIDTTGTSGLVTLVAGVVTYDPNGAFEHLGAGESTLDVFSYTVSDGNGGTDTATVTVTIDGANDAPEAVDDTVTTERATPVVVDVAGNDGDADGDALQASVSTQPANGLALVVDTGIAYVPDSGFVGDDAFDYSVSDGNGGLAIGQVAVTVQTPISEIPGTSGRDFLFGTTGDDVVLAGDGVDRISGDQGDDTLLGEGGVDLVNGGPGNDVIFGGLGRDSLLGGPGNDLFVIGETDDFDFLSDFEVGSDQVLLTIETLLTADGLLDADRVRALDTTGNDLLLQVDVGAGFQTIANLNDAAGSALADILFNRLDNETL